VVNTLKKNRKQRARFSGESICRDFELRYCESEAIELVSFSKMLCHSIIIAALVLALLPFQRSAAKGGDEAVKDKSLSSETTTNCYNPSDPNEIKLWEARAPGSSGDDPCRDIPFLRIYSAPEASQVFRPAILLIPGGGYDRLTDRKEQAPVAAYFSHKLGLTTFVLYYRLVQSDGTYRYPVPMWDGQRALKLIRYRAKDYGVDSSRVGVFGFSAGGHLASTLAVHSATDFNLPVHDAVDAMNGRPDFLGLGYPVISMIPRQFASRSSLSHLLYGYQSDELDGLEEYLSAQDNVARNTPPVFLFESMDDKRISPQNSVIFAQALRAAHIPADVHFFAHGVHGAGLAANIPEEQTWPDLFHRWLVSQGFLAPERD
jgi:acetyl esterase/lipase